MSSEDSFEFEDDGEELAVGAVGTVAVPEVPAETVSESREIPAKEEELVMDSEESVLVEENSPALEPVQDKEASSPLLPPQEAVSPPAIDPSPQVEVEIPANFPADASEVEDISKSHEPTDSIAGSIDPFQGTIAELLNVPLARLRKRPDHKKDEAKSAIPVLNRDTENPNTYDLDYLLEAQIRTKAAHRFVTPSESALAPSEKAEDTSDVDFIKRNIESTLRPKLTQSSFASSMSLEAFPAKKTKVLSVKQAGRLADRLVSYKQQVEMKVKQTQESMRYRETQACTFAPEIGKTKANGPRRRPEEMYYEGLSRAKEQQERQERLRETQIVEVSNFHPAVNQQSVKMLEKRGRDPTPVYEKLYSAHKDEVKRQLQGGNARSRSTGDVLTFKPVINKRSEELSRPKKVNDALYDDAKRRQERQKEVPKLQPFEPKLSKHSEKVLLTRFEEDFGTAWGRYSGSNVLTSSTPLRQLLQDMGFDSLTEEESAAAKIWELLEGESRGGVRRGHLLTVLAAVMHFKPKQSTDLPSKDGKFGRFEGEDFLLHSKELQRLHKAFEAAYEARLLASKRPIAPNPKKSTAEVYSFKPDLRQSAKGLRGRARSHSVSSERGSDRETRLLGEPERLQSKLQQARELLEQKKMSECTFKPTLKPSKYTQSAALLETTEPTAGPTKRQTDRNLALYQMAQLAKAKRELQAKENAEIQRELEANECTFTPNVDLFE